MKNSKITNFSLCNFSCTTLYAEGVAHSITALFTVSRILLSSKILIKSVMNSCASRIITALLSYYILYNVAHRHGMTHEM